MANSTGLIQRVNPSDLYHMACRMDSGQNFGYNGWQAIGEYLEGYSDAIGEPVEIDIIGICCDYASADSVEAWWENYGAWKDIDHEEWAEASEDDKLKLMRDYLQDHTSVVCCEPDCIIWLAF